jgi:REP element-mobilizing transposase RayT
MSRSHLHVGVTKISAAYFVVALKGKSSLMIFDKHVNLKYTEADIFGAGDIM